VTIGVGPTVEVMARPVFATSAAAVPRTLSRVSGAVVDVSLAFAIFLIGLPSVFREPNGQPHVAMPMLFDVALSLPLIFRRRRPMYVFGFIAAVAFAQWVTGARYTADIALLVAFYTVAAHEDRRRTTAAAVVLEVGIALAVVRWSPGHGAVLVFVLLSGMASAALFIGTTMRTRRAYLASLEDRAMRLELERDQQAQIVAAAERARIARDMHDIVAHNLSVMIALADGAALTMSNDPARAAAAVNQVSATGRQALMEMRRLLGVLRDSAPAALEPQPSVLDLDQLLGQVRLVGLRGELVTDGSIPPLPAGLQLTVYRLVQEALTNTLKHALDARTATVRLRLVDEGLEVEVTDDGASVSPSVGTATPPVGHGITGMQERAAIYGGTVEAGPRTTRGWRVRAWFDLRLNEMTRDVSVVAP
jgi:signal transduction histidine kinase